LKEAHSSRVDAVNIWRGEVAASVTGDVGIARSSARIKMMFGGFEAGWAYAPMPPDASAAVPRVALRSPAGSQVKVTFQLRVIGFNRHVIASRLSLPTAPPARAAHPREQLGF